MTLRELKSLRKRLDKLTQMRNLAVCGNCKHWRKTGEKPYGVCEIKREPKFTKTAEHPEGTYITPHGIRVFSDKACKTYFDPKEEG